MSQQNHILVIGGGRVGSAIIHQLNQRGHPCSVIDRDVSILEQLLIGGNGTRVCGDATRMAILEQAHVHEAAAVIAATGSDTVNLMVTRIVRQWYGIRIVLARVSHPEMRSVYQEQGIPTFSPAGCAAESVIREINTLLTPE